MARQGEVIPLRGFERPWSSVRWPRLWSLWVPNLARQGQILPLLWITGRVASPQGNWCSDHWYCPFSSDTPAEAFREWVLLDFRAALMHGECCTQNKAKLLLDNYLKSCGLMMKRVFLCSRHNCCFLVKNTRYARRQTIYSRIYTD